MKVLIADKFPDLYLKKLQELGLDVVYNPKMGEEDIANNSKDFNIIIVRSTKVNAKAIENSTNLNLIIRAGAGVDNIDIQAANKKGIYVANCPGKNSIAVAELTIGLMLSLDRRIPDNVADFHKGIWNKEEYSKANGLFGRNLALIGVGNIGKEVAKRALALGMNVFGKDISRIEGVPIKDFSEMDKVLPIADVISIHLPLTPQTRGLFNKQMFDCVKPGAIFINTSRAEIVEEDALIEAIKTKNLKVGLDVISEEPEAKKCEFKSKLQGLPNVYVTHHIGASTEQAQLAVAEETYNIVKTFLQSGLIANWVNRETIPETKYQLTFKYNDRPGVLSAVFNILREEDVNIEDLENQVFDGGLVACCSMKFKKDLSHNIIEQIKLMPNILSVSFVQI
jgi:D-3-phosphoglycerate dehydrogenase